jgi:hypothetical protein
MSSLMACPVPNTSKIEAGCLPRSPYSPLSPESFTSPFLDRGVLQCSITKIPFSPA